ncbi:MAG: alginate export family protein, partial [Bacteroidales bacterium]
WNFAKTKGSPTISYRYAYFSGDNPDSKSYNKWDALYTGGNGEQWVQGSNMYKIIQNSNEITHRLQCVYQPFKKTQIVVQLWLFYAAQKNNIGGNPALSTLNSKFYGSEYNLTLKYFYSRNWYFHLNTAYTIPGCAIKGVVTNTKNWFCLSFFARYSF